MLRAFVVAALLLTVSSNARTVDSSLHGQQIEETPKIGDVEVTGTFDKDHIQDAIGEISVEAYPFKIGLLRDSNKQFNVHVLMNSLFTLLENNMIVKWDSLLGQSSAQTELDYASYTLPGAPDVRLQGLWDYQNEARRTGQLTVSMSDRKGNIKFRGSMSLKYNRNTKLDASLTIGPVTVSLRKDEAGLLEDTVDMILPSVQVGNALLQISAGAHQNPQRQTDFYLSTNSGLFQGRINIDSAVNVDVIGGITLYNVENDGIQLQVTHFHTNQNEFMVRFTLGPLNGLIAIDKYSSRIAAVDLDFSFVKFNVNIGKDGKAEYQATGVLDPLTINGKGNENGLLNLSAKLNGGNLYSIYLSTNVEGKYNVDLIAYGQAFTFQL